MEPMSWIFLASVVASMITGTANIISNRKATREANATNIQLQREQNQWNEQQWQKNNEYNSPRNQVELMREAGLNPAAMAGGAVGFQASDPAQGAEPARVTPNTWDPSSITAMMDALGSIAQKSADTKIKTLDFDRKAFETDAIVKERMASIELMQKEGNLKDADVELRKAQLQSEWMEVQRLKAVVSNTNMDTRRIGKEIKKLGLESDRLEKLLPLEYEKLGADIGLSKEKTKLVMQQTVKTLIEAAVSGRELDIKTVEASLAQSFADAGLDEAKARASIVMYQNENKESIFTREQITGYGNFASGVIGAASLWFMRFGRGAGKIGLRSLGPLGLFFGAQGSANASTLNNNPYIPSSYNTPVKF